MTINLISVSGIASSSTVAIAGGISVSGQPVTISGGHVFVESGIYLASGLYVVADIAESGMGVQIQSGANVIIQSGVYFSSGLYVASGLYVVADITESGMGVQVQSGVYLASGMNVTVSSGLGVSISGQHIYVESGVYVASGLYVVADIAESGMGVQVQSGLSVIVQSGVYVAIQSGAVVIADWMTEDKLLLYQIANPPNLDKTVNAIRTQQTSGVVTVTGGSITATVAGTNVNVSGFVDIQGRMLPINMNNLAWAQVVRTRIT